MTSLKSTAASLEVPGEVCMDDVDYDFVEKPSKEFYCPITFDLLREPHQTLCCGNHLSHEAVTKLQQSRDPCPLCNKFAFKTLPDKFFKRKVNDLQVRCLNKGKGCGWVGELGSLDQHLNKSLPFEGDCQFVTVDCPHSCGVHFQRSQFVELQEHETSSCPNRPFACEFCGYKATYNEVTGEHCRICEKYPVECPNRDQGCQWSGTQGDIDRHLNYDSFADEGECQFVSVACPYDCDDELQRREIDGHKADDCPNRPFTCRYCSHKATYNEVINEHWASECEKYPLPCPRECGEEGIKRQDLEKHFRVCPTLLKMGSTADVLPFEEVKEKPYTQAYLQLQAEKEVLQEESRESHEIIRTSDVKTTEDLRGVEVIAGTRFVTKGRHPQTFEWRNRGLKISVPELSDGVELAIDIKAGLAGQFKLPAGAQLVSPVYWLCCRQKFEYPVTLEIQHCAVIRNQTECSSLQFVAAKCSQEVLPYVFKPLRHGIFSMDSSFGTIEVKQFSLFGIIAWFSPPRKYFTQLYYIVKGANTWQLHFIMAWNLPLCIEAIQSTYSHLSIEPGPDMLVQFKKEAISLNIPKGGITENGWQITPLFPPVITKQQVDEFKPGQRIPSCQFKVKWIGEGSPKAWETEVTLHGAEDHHAQQHAPFVYFTISLPPDHYNMKRPVTENVQDTGTAVPLLFSEPHLKHLVLIGVNNWYNLGLQLNLKVKCLEEIKSNNHGTIEDCRREMFCTWLRTQTNPSYKQLVTALVAIGENKEASQLCEKYGILMPS